MAGLVEDTMSGYVREARCLYETLFLTPFDKSGRERCETYLRLLTRYEFLSQMFSDLNWFDWRDDDFNVTERLK